PGAVAPPCGGRSSGRGSGWPAPSRPPRWASWRRRCGPPPSAAWPSIWSPTPTPPSTSPTVTGSACGGAPAGGPDRDQLALVVGDGEETVLVDFGRDRPEGMWTHHPAVALLAAEHLRGWAESGITGRTPGHALRGLG